MAANQSAHWICLLSLWMRTVLHRSDGAAMLERLPGAELIRLRGVGHVPMSDDPAGVAELILQVTAAVDGAAVSTERADRDA